MPKEKGPRISYEIPIEINKELEMIKQLHDKLGNFKPKHKSFDELVNESLPKLRAHRIALETKLKELKEIINE